jgi:hypothetical protein
MADKRDLEPLPMLLPLDRLPGELAQTKLEIQDAELI